MGETMKMIQLSSGVIPLSEFKREASRILAELKQGEGPFVLTQNGRPSAVLLAPAEFDRMIHKLEYTQSVSRGLADAPSGRVHTAEQVRGRVLNRKETE